LTDGRQLAPSEKEDTAKVSETVTNNLLISNIILMMEDEFGFSVDLAAQVTWSIGAERRRSKKQEKKKMKVYINVKMVDKEAAEQVAVIAFYCMFN
jgi:single-stranded DNA-binding protein